jgi:hypothetical protein
LEFIRAGGEEAQVVDIQETTDPQVLAFVEDCGTGEFPFQVIYQVCSKDSVNPTSRRFGMIQLLV